MTSIDNFADEIMEALEEYKLVSVEELEKAAKEIAKEGVKKLKEKSPKGKGSKKGHYSDGWGISVIFKSGTKFEIVIHNKKKPGLTHLLENGHQLRQGGRASAILHIKEVEEWCNREYELRVKERLQG